MIEPKVRPEIEDLLAYIDEQLDGIRNAAHGLTEEQARLTPCRSALSIGGLVKHATWVLTGWRRRLDPEAPATPQLGEEQVRSFMSSFALAADETFDRALAAMDAARDDVRPRLLGLDPEAPNTEPPAPWYGRTEPVTTTTRFALLHSIEEFARHAGHADVIREQIDGAGAMPLDAAVNGRPENPFVAPWQPHHDNSMT